MLDNGFKKKKPLKMWKLWWNKSLENVMSVNHDIGKATL